MAVLRSLWRSVASGLLTNSFHLNAVKVLEDMRWGAPPRSNGMRLDRLGPRLM